MQAMPFSKYLGDYVGFCRRYFHVWISQLFPPMHVRFFADARQLRPARDWRAVCNINSNKYAGHHADHLAIRKAAPVAKSTAITAVP